MPTRTFHAENLEVQIHASRAEMGEAGAGAVADAIGEILRSRDSARVIFASAPSQNEFLAELRQSRAIEWPRVEAFHLDEYVGLPAGHPASFRRFLRDRLIDHVPIHAFHELQGDAEDPDAECARYAALLANAKPDWP